MIRTVIYLHGFLSSPDSAKGRILGRCVRGRGADFLAPDLNLHPRDAMRRVRGAAGGLEPGSFAIAGSSLGGFYASVLAAETGCRAALVNPAVTPWDGVGERLGRQKTALGRDIEVLPGDAGELREMDRGGAMEPERLLVMLTTGDEVLDWRRAFERHAAGYRWVIGGEDHTVSGFARWADALTDFLLSGSLPGPAPGSRLYGPQEFPDRREDGFRP